MSAATHSLDFAAVRAAGFPIYSLYRKEKRDELLKLLEYDRTGIIKDGVVGQTMHGLSLAWNYQPHAWGVRCGKMLTPLQVFGDDRLLEQALVRRRKLGSCKTDSDLRKAVRTFSGTQSVSNYRPTAAAAIYDRYLPKDGGLTWDMSVGFGGRLLGAMACKQVLKYIGTDPATLTMDGLCDMRDELAPMMEYLGHHVPKIELHRIGSEDFTPEPESLDLCFSSTPYGRHEQYSDEPTQSYLKFPTNEQWLNGYLRMTLANCHIGLKPDGFLVVNIAGVKSYPTLHTDFVSLAESSGWQLLETLQLALSKMPGTGKETAAHKWEPVYVFRKAALPCVKPTSPVPISAVKDRRSRIAKLLNSSADENWGTPQSFFDDLNAEFDFTLDAAASPSNHKCERYYTKEADSLGRPWSGRVFCNPPYGAKMSPAFMRKAAAERNNCEVIVMLVPSRTSTQWCRDTVWHGDGPRLGVTLRFPGRIKNDTRNHPSKSERRWPFPSSVIVFRPDEKRESLGIECQTQV